MKNRYLFFFLIGSLVLINACQKEYSFEGGSGPSEGTLQDDGTGDCLPKTVSGTYVAGTVLDGTVSYIEVQVNVTKTGSYTIYTDTVNGIHFRGTGVFTNTGLNTVRLKGNGTPATAGISNFIVSYGTSACTISVTVAGSLAAFTLGGAPGSCTAAAPAGTYTVGVPLTSANTVNINVIVTAVGAYNVSTTLSNGIVFTGSGIFTVTGSQSIILSAEGTTPAASGSTNIPVVAGSSSCAFTVNVTNPAAPANYTVNCGTPTINGTYTQNTALTASNTVGITVDVVTPGTYSITATGGGMTFTASGTFATAGTGLPVTLTGVTTGAPNTSGAVPVAVTGGTASCNFTVNVVAAAGAATFSVNCATATVNGTYTQNTALTAANTISLPVTVTAVGTYAINATLNGMTFSASGTFATATPQTVTLAGSGTPTTQGPNSIPVTGGTGTCNITVTVNPAAGGAAVFVVDCTSASENGTYTQGVALTAANTINIDVNVTTIGTYTITTTLTNGITFSASGTFATTGVQTIALTGNGTPTAGGTFSIPVPGTTPCSFSLIVDPSYGTWSFKVGTTTYSGTIYEAAFDNTTAPPLLIFYFLGTNAAGDDFEIDLVDIAGGVLTNEQYNCAVFTGAANTGAVYYVGVSGTTYDADFSMPTNTMLIKVTSHNTATKTMIGTFSGKMILNGGTTLADITTGQFTVTYP